MKFISLGIIDRKFWIPVFGGIIAVIFNIIVVYFPKFDILNGNPFVKSIYITLGNILEFIPFIIIKHKSKAVNKINNEQIIKSKLYIKLKDSKNVFKKTKFRKYRFIFYSTIFEFLETFLRVVFIVQFIFNYWIFDIIFMSIFSFLILKTKYYKHQFISMIAIIIFGFGLNIIAYFKFDCTEDLLISFSTFIQFIAEICFCL